MSVHPKQKKTDYTKMPIETLVSLIEHALPGWTFNVHYLGKMRPVMMNWSHHHMALTKWESAKLLLRAMTFKDLKTGLVAILERLDAYAEAVEAEKKRVAAEQKRREAIAHIAVEREAAREAARQRRKEEAKKPEPKDDEPVLKVEAAAPVGSASSATPASRA